MQLPVLSTSFKKFNKKKRFCCNSQIFISENLNFFYKFIESLLYLFLYLLLIEFNIVFVLEDGQRNTNFNDFKPSICFNSFNGAIQRVLELKMSSFLVIKSFKIS